MSSVRPGAALASVVALCATASHAQVPGPTSPTPPNPQSKPGATMVINPTEDECRKGWDATLKWTKEQFEEFCARLKVSK
jgi:hypothetical protein